MARSKISRFLGAFSATFAVPLLITVLALTELSAQPAWGQSEKAAALPISSGEGEVDGEVEAESAIEAEVDGSVAVEPAPETTELPGSAPAASLPSPPSPREVGLARVLEARLAIESDLRAAQRALRSDAATGREADLEATVRTLALELNDLNRNFSELAAGVDPTAIDVEPGPQELNLTSEVRDLLGPLVNELKRATSRPREIDRLRTEIAELGDQLGQVNSALDRLVTTESNLRDPELMKAVSAEQRDWKRRQSALSAALQVAEQKLAQRLGESQTIAEAVENLFQLFFKSRGRNLLLALVAMIGFLFIIRRLRSFLSSRPAVTKRKESLEGRVFGLIYSGFTVIGALLVFLISLYFFGDWVLLILVLLLILGFIWTSKQAIPRFWTQTVLILDMGAVREGERIIYNGLPWRIDSISFYSTITNPALKGGSLRLPIDDLSEFRSRAFDESEPWFPTREGDVVLLPDGRPGKVEFQSIEAVRVRTPGDNILLTSAADFASQGVERISDGYRVGIAFGLDYADQAEITTSMRLALERGVETRWRDSRWANSLVSCAVEFKEASASSLDYYVRVDLDGSQAMDLQAQRRALSRFCVDVCNEHGWVIPFQQITLHVAPPAESVAPASDILPTVD